jgi:predicted acylesterase/phospholipase RssA
MEASMSEGDDRPDMPVEGALLPCDIVMAGGVTSGIIYPGAVAMIARRFSFHSIGGTSVGAIAAAVTAAAEYGRRTGRNPRAFDDLAALAVALAEKAPTGHSRLFHLFTPEPATRPLMALLTPLMSKSGIAGKAAALLPLLREWRLSLPLLVALVASAALVVALASELRLALALIALAGAAALLAIVAVVALVLLLRRHWLPAWAANGYGICTGKTSPDVPHETGEPAWEGLTPWMHGVVQRAAGRKPGEPPLTFGDLWQARAPGGATGAADPAAPRAIDLSMIASDISRNRTVQIPFVQTPSPLYADLALLRRYFPDDVVDWMERRAGDDDPRIAKREGVIRLPMPQDLPVVFGARLSLSFPILLSAVPLLTPDFATRRGRDEAIPLRTVWFSDGGLTSNFPIHLFDSPIPARPTFCLNLVDFDAEVPSAELSDDSDSPDEAAFDQPGLGQQDKPITRPQAPERTARERPIAPTAADPQPGDKVWGFVSMAKGNRFTPVPFTAFDSGAGSGLLSFAKTLLNTARFWSDNQMLIAPGVRDRVVHVALRDDEGGLNLDMAADVIADLDLRGRAAGLLISARFDPLAPLDPETGEPNEEVFANHRWVRYRNFMAAFEDLSRRFATARRASDEAAADRGEPSLDEMIAGLSATRVGYPAPAAAREYYRAMTDAFEALALDMAARTRTSPEETFDRPRRLGAKPPAGAAPRPKMRIRLRPMADNDPRGEQADLPGLSETPLSVVQAERER